MDGLAKSVGQQKLDRFWLFRVNDPLKLYNIGACFRMTSPWKDPSAEDVDTDFGTWPKNQGPYSKLAEMRS